MKVLFASAEVAPFAKVGGLADVTSALPVYLKKKRVNARIIMPKYKAINPELLKDARLIGNTYVTLGWRRQYAGLFELKWRGITVYFVDNEYYFGGDRIYGYIEGEAERYAFFCRAVLELLPLMDFMPDIIHCNDWQTGLIPALLKTQYPTLDIRTVMTIHNLKYQGIYGIDAIKDLMGFPNSMFTSEGMEFYGGASLLKSGIIYADRVTTVSRTYASETKSEYFGERMQGVLESLGQRYTGIINGIDYEEYNPSADTLIPAQFDAADMTGRTECKAALQEMLGLRHSDAPIIAFVGRLYDQKGLGLIEEALPELLGNDDFQLVVLGTGEPHFEELFRTVARNNPGRAVAVIGFDNALAHRIYAGADFLLMPSRFEPCGLSQLIAMRYGCLPIVRETGGLRDTVSAYNQYENTGNGFSFGPFCAADMMHTIRYALQVYAIPEAVSALRERAMKSDFSWQKSALEYKKLYTQILNGVN